ncbi:hypothetical protein KBI33_01930 [Candidatus Shapirobacteria bacterium]|nr:hypothetical protein [Candidatus Shapirobacteria bacterium]
MNRENKEAIDFGIIAPKIAPRLIKASISFSGVSSEEQHPARIYPKKMPEILPVSGNTFNFFLILFCFSQKFCHILFSCALTFTSPTKVSFWNDFSRSPRF